MSEEEIVSFSVKKLSILDSDGNVDESLMPELSDDDIRTMYWHMNLSKLLNTKMLNLQKQGRMGTLASIRGQEGVQIGAASASSKYDNTWFVPTFRENAALLAHGVPMERIMQYWGGYELGSKISKDLKNLPVSIPIGSQLTHAQGIAHSMNIKGEKGAVIAFFGDGATSEGETHEALNFAGVFNTPLVFLCQNNQYAISLPRAKQTRSETLAQKAIAYGFEGIQVDGNDIFAVYKAVKEALEKAYNGGGPTFIEAVTYRMDNHTTADDWHKYRSEEEVKGWEAKDPILRLRKYMEKKGIWDEEHEKNMLEDAKRKVEEAEKIYLETPAPKPEEMFDYLYADIPHHVQKQKEYFVKFWGEH